MEPESEAAAIESLINILPDDSYNLGQAEEPQEEPKQAEPEAPEAKSDEPPAEPDEYEIEVDGERYKVPAKLKNSFMMQQDYTKKTMELAEQRKAIGDPKEIEQFKQQITYYQSLAVEALNTNENNLAAINKELMETDVNADPLKVVQLTQQKARIEAQILEGRAVKARLDEENRQKQSQALNQEWEQLIAKRPEWKDEAVRKADREGIEKFLTTSGYTKADVDAIADHRALIIADKARRYDELMAAKTEVVKRVEKLPPRIERPGVPSGSDGQASKAAMDSLRKSGGIDDAAMAIRSLMG